MIVVPAIADRSRWQIINPEGETLEVSDYVNGMETIKGMSGRGMPPIEASFTVVPGKPGASIHQVRHGIREIDFPIHIAGESWADLQRRQAELIDHIDPIRGQSILRYIDGNDGHISELSFIYVGGLSLDSDGANGPISAVRNLILQSPDPYWYGEEVTQTWHGTNARSWFPILPLSLAGSLIQTALVTNSSPGDVWPVWTFEGPGYGPTITNLTTGKVLGFNTTLELGIGDTLTIDTRTGAVTGPQGTSWRRYLSRRSMFPLVKGGNQIKMALNGSTSDSAVTVAYRNWSITP